jgi:hypothetical protein
MARGYLDLIRGSLGPVYTNSVIAAGRRFRPTLRFVVKRLKSHDTEPFEQHIAQNG